MIRMILNHTFVTGYPLPSSSFFFLGGGGVIFNFVGLFNVIFFHLYHKKILGKSKCLGYREITASSYCFQQLIPSRFFSGKSDVDIYTMFADHTLITRRNVTSDTHSSYRAHNDFFQLCLHQG